MRPPTPRRSPPDVASGGSAAVADATGGVPRDAGDDADDAPGAFAAAVVAWQRRAGRHDLPWQRTRDPYRIWVSEIMLQQTQVGTVLGYYGRFLERFPDVAALARAEPDEVLGLWSGLGYYSRARNLHACARAVVERHGGVFPADPAALEALPGIGRSTAAAIAAFAWGVRAPILDGNVKRVLCRVFAVDGFPGERAVALALWALAERELPDAGDGAVEAYTQGLMDLGATLCTRSRPRCHDCPVAARCGARLQGRVDALPAKRPARRVAVRTAELVLLLSGDAVLLERRPATGLWGGLWSLPEFSPPAKDGPASQADAAAVSAWVGRRFGVRVAQAAVHGEIRHAFTHFRLQARVWQVRLEAGAPVPAGVLERLAPRDAGAAPLPRPVRSLLEGLDDTAGRAASVASLRAPDAAGASAAPPTGG